MKYYIFQKMEEITQIEKDINPLLSDDPQVIMKSLCSKHILVRVVRDGSVVVSKGYHLNLACMYCCYFVYVLNVWFLMPV